MSDVLELDPFVRKKDVVAFTGFASSGIDLLVQKKEFPAPYKIGPRAVGWKRSELIKWQESRRRVE